MSAIDFVTREIELAGKKVLDIGCGSGAFASILLKHGADVCGIDPSPSAIAAARAVAEPARFEVASAEALPFQDKTFDTCIFLNSLHHVPPESMPAALDEAHRTTKANGLVVIIEPLAEGSFFDVFRLIEDETAVRGSAQIALESACASGVLRLVRSTIVIRSETFSSFEAFVSRATAAAPDRLHLINLRLAEIERAFRARVRDEDSPGVRLDQPLKIDILFPL